MPKRIGDASWTVLRSPENDEHNRCVDIFQRPDGSWGFGEFRRDPEDEGAWTPVAYHSVRRFPSQAQAEQAAAGAVPWFGPTQTHT